MCIPLAVSGDEDIEYQLRRLFFPTVSEYAAEKRGIIHIYEGLTSTQVDDALDKHFERIDNIMFIKIVHISEDGEEFVEEDGCE